MHAVINHVHLDIPVRQLQQSFEDEALPLLAGLPGFRGCYCVEEAPDRVAFIILWDSEQAAINGGQVMGPGWFAKTIAPHLASDQQRTVGEIIAQRHP